MGSPGWSHRGLEAQDLRDPDSPSTSTSCPTQDPAQLQGKSEPVATTLCPDILFFSDQDSLNATFHLLPNTPVQPCSKRAIQEHSRLHSRLQLGNHLPPCMAARAFREITPVC